MKEYILFKKEKAGKGGRYNDFIDSLYSRAQDCIDGEEWKDEEKKDEKDEYTLSFVAAVKTPKDVAEIVRKDPLSKFVLFHGEMQEIKVAIPVFANGKNLQTLDSEWKEQ